MAKSGIIDFPKNRTSKSVCVDSKSSVVINSLFTATNIVTSQLDEFFSSYGLTHARWQVLVLYANNGNKGRPSYIAEKQNVSRATATGLIVGLEKDGFVTRAPCVKDGRQICVSLTSKAKKAIKDISPLYNQKINDLLAGLTQTESQDIQHLLSKLILKNIVA